MAIVFPNEGRILALDNLLRNSPAAKLRLFQNDVDVDADTELGDLTEATFPGYAEIDLAFDAPTINGDGQGEVTEEDLTFTAAGIMGPQTIYGWYIVLQDPTPTAKLFLCENFPSPVLVENDDDEVKFDLTLVDQLATP